MLYSTGVAAGWDNGKVGVEAGYGRFKDAWKSTEDEHGDVHGDNWATVDSTEAWYGKLTGHIADAADVSAFYLKNTQKQDGTDVAAAGKTASAWGAGLSMASATSPSMAICEDKEHTVW